MSEVTMTISDLWNGTATSYSPYNILMGISSQTGDVLIAIDAPYMGDAAPVADAGRLENLHEYEVVELFITGANPTAASSPYLEIQIGPHGHYMLIFFMKEAGWDTQDPTIDLDQPPKVQIDYAAKRWTAEIAVPSYLLPQPESGADLSVSWNMNAYAAFGQNEERTFLACYPVPGTAPNFHQLKCFRPVKLYETNEIRDVVDRGVSIVNDKIRRMTLNDDCSEEASGKDLSGDADENSLKGPKYSEGEVVLVAVVDVARTLRDKIAESARSPSLLHLEEKFQIHIQAEHGEFAVLHSKVWKRKGISFKRRTLILTSKPRLFYLDGAGRYKGAIPWTMAQRIRVKKVGSKSFEISLPEDEGGRIYHLFCGTWGADVWVNTISDILTAQKTYLRLSRKV